MNHKTILDQLNTQLIENLRNYYPLIKKQEQLSTNKNLILSIEKRIQCLFKLIQVEITKIKNIDKKKHDIQIYKETYNKNNQKLIKLDELLRKAKNNLIKNTNVLKCSSNTKNFNSFNLNQILLENCALKYSSNITAPDTFKKHYFFPRNYKYAFPDENLEIKNSLLKFSTQNILEPPEYNPKPVNDKIKRGSTVTLFYPDTSVKNVFFKYTMMSIDDNYRNIDQIPTYFNGELYSESSKPIINNHVIFKCCSCKFGYRDSKIITIRFEVHDDYNLDKLKEHEVEINQDRPERPDEIGSGGINVYFKPIDFTPGDDSASLIGSNPGSAYINASMQRESSHRGSDYQPDISEL